jgi:HAD superfamily phosphatase (TIGR01668 family)
MRYIMLKILYPQLYVNTILDIPLQELKKANIKAFILDLDNTVTSWNSSHVTEEIIEWFNLIKVEGFKACILSNNGEKRVLAVAESLGIPYIHRAQKPRRGAFYRAVELMGVTAGETAVIGDQIFTDVLGGNRAGLFTILVVPISSKEFMGTKVSRFFEFWVKRYLIKELKNPGM